MKPRPGGAGGGTRSLVLFPGALGDAVCLEPAIARLARNGPVAVVARGAAAEVARLFPAAPATRSLDAPEIARLFAPRAAGGDAPAVTDWLVPFDRIVSFTGASDAAFRDRLLATGRAVVNPFPRPGAGPHASDQLLRHATGDPFAVAPPPRLVAPPAGEAARRLQRLPRPVLVLHPGAGAGDKRAPAATFADLARRWRERGGGVAVLLGPAEAGEQARFGALGEVVLPRDVADLTAAIAAGAAFAGNDSGPAHVAGALGVVAVALFVRDPGSFAPRGRRMQIVRLPASPHAADGSWTEALEASWRALARALP